MSSERMNKQLKNVSNSGESPFLTVNLSFRAKRGICFYG